MVTVGGESKIEIFKFNITVVAICDGIVRIRRVLYIIKIFPLITDDS